MSTGADCFFYEFEPGKWKYKIQRWPYGEWEEYDTNGPFNSFVEALEHLNAYYANPGGWSTKINKNHVHEKENTEEGFDCASCGAKMT